MLLILILALLLLCPGSVPAVTADANMMQKVFLTKQVFPNAKTIGVICNTQHSASLLQPLKLATEAYQLQIKIYDARDLMQLRSSFERMIRDSKIDVVWIVSDDVVNQQYGRRFLAEKCMSLKIPLFVPVVDLLREGALFTVSTDTENTPKVFVNRKVRDLLGIAFPEEIQAKIVEIEY